jgi:AcrR family transcriptional regulator
MQPSGWLSTLNGVVHDSQATKRRLLDAAFDEFVAVGLAGARVDRIARAAAANKQAIYAYFGSKELLFDTVLTERLQLFSEQVPLTPHDLPGYAGALFDMVSAHPDHLRLRAWKQLERPELSAEETAAYAAKIGALEEAYDFDAGRGGAQSLWMLMLSAVTSATVLSLSEPRDPVSLAGHRAAVIATVRALVDTLTRPTLGRGS